jgi:3-oxoacyl-[acyl-carrier-protein] synthase-3
MTRDTFSAPPVGWAVQIAALGYYLPERIVTNAELEESLQLKSGWIARVTGVEERRYASPDETSLFMAKQAAERALASAGLTLADIDLIVGASAAIPQMIPCSAALLQRELGGQDGASFCFDINATCLSFLVALHTIAPLLSTGVYRRALIFSSENRSYSLNPDEPESATLIGDAAVAVIVTATPAAQSSCLHHARFATFGSGANFTQLRGGGTRHHPNDPTTLPEMNYFQMNGPAVYRMAATVLPPFLDNFLTAVGWERAELEAVIPHQASGHGVRYIAARCGFSPEQVIFNLPKRGNCVAASLPLALAEAVESRRIRRGNRLLLTGTGAGLTIGAIALTW